MDCMKVAMVICQQMFLIFVADHWPFILFLNVLQNCFFFSALAPDPGLDLRVLVPLRVKASVCKSLLCVRAFLRKSVSV